MSEAVTIRDSVSDLLTDHGEPVTLRHRVAGIYNPATGSYSGGSVVAAVVSMFVAPYREDLIDGSSILPSDAEGLISPRDLEAAGVTPEAVDAVERGTEKFRVVSVQKQKIATEIIYYSLHLRGAS